MARTINEINDDLTANFVDNTIVQQIYGLTLGNTFVQEFSKVSFESILFYTIATSIYTLEKLFDIHKEWIDKRAKELKGGSLPWYVTKSKEFQYGDALAFSDDTYIYPIINEANKIVKLAAATEIGNQVLLKVANIDSSGDIIKLTTGELDAFKCLYEKTKVCWGKSLICIKRS